MRCCYSHTKAYIKNHIIKKKNFSPSIYFIIITRFNHLLCIINIYLGELEVIENCWKKNQGRAIYKYIILYNFVFVAPLCQGVMCEVGKIN